MGRVDISHLTPQKPNRFYWWRRFKYRILLPNKAGVISRIRNGDFELSDYYIQSKYELELADKEINKLKPLLNSSKTKEGAQEKINNLEKMKFVRYNKLTKDFVDDETWILEEFRNYIIKLYKFELNNVRNHLEHNVEGYENIPSGVIGINRAYDYVMDLVLERALKEDTQTTEEFFRLYCNVIVNFQPWNKIKNIFKYM